MGQFLKSTRLDWGFSVAEMQQIEGCGDWPSWEEGHKLPALHEMIHFLNALNRVEWLQFNRLMNELLTPRPDPVNSECGIPKKEQL